MRMLKNIFCVVGGLLREVLYPVVYTLKAMSGYAGDILEVLLPYGMLLLGAYLYKHRGMWTVGYELLIPIIVRLIIGMIRTCANKMNKGKRVPLPKKRFTTVDEDGEVSIENSRIQELLLYVADLEDWFHRKGWM